MPTSIFDGVFANALPAPGHGANHHVLLTGPSGFGKTKIIVAIGRNVLANPALGFHQVDPEGDICEDHLEFVAANKLSWRKVHYLSAGSPTHSFALPLLYVRDPTPLLCHEAAVRAVTVLARTLNFGLGDYGPRLSKLLQLGCYGLALTGRPLIDLPELFTRNARVFREIIGESFPYHFLSDEWLSLDVLNDRTFLDYRDALMSRMIPLFSNARLRRIFGPQQPPVDIAHILANRECVLLNLAGLEHKDAVLVGGAYLSLFYHQALTRPANRSPHTVLAVDEAFDFLHDDVIRGFDRLRKRNVQLLVGIQRLGAVQK